MVLVASEEQLRAFQTAAPSERRVTEDLRGALAETATTGRVRYEWALLAPVISVMIEQVLREFDAEEAVDVGPRQPLPFGESLDELIARLQACVAAFRHAPFTVQRLCELLLEPHKQYTRLGKVAMALDKLLLVTSTVPVGDGLPCRPDVASLGPVNDNPPRVEQAREAGAADRSPRPVFPNSGLRHHPSGAPYSISEEGEAMPKLNNGQVVGYPPTSDLPAAGLAAAALAVNVSAMDGGAL
eukprot:evm.model.scf_2717.3 EVM.evm.TU.scf_2717.3   scf_2717:16883-17608(+)